MEQTIMVIYEKGLLRPLTPLDLPENQPVQIKILSPEPLTPTQLYLQELAQLGLVTPPQQPAAAQPMSELARQELAQRLGQTLLLPLSKVIIEERGP